MRVRVGGGWWPGQAPAEAVSALRTTLGPGARILVVEHGGRSAHVVGAPGALPQVWDADPDRVPDGPGAPGAWVGARWGADRLHLVRDPIGHRSLYWATPAEGVLVFASTLAGVLAVPGVERGIDPEAVVRFLVYAYLPGGRSLVRGIHALPAGHRLSFGGEAPRVVREWELPPVDEAPVAEAALRDTLRAELEAVVDAHLPAPGAPVSATLSGGIDSSLVLALATRRREVPAVAWSITFGAPHRDELEFSALLAAHVGAEHRVVSVTPADVRARFDATVQALSAPNGDPLTVPNDRLFAAAAEVGDTLLNGEGGDPTFGGPKNGPMLLSALFDDDRPGPAYLRAHQRLYDDLDGLLHADLDPAGLRTTLEDEVEAELGSRAGMVDALMAVNVVYKGAWHILPKVDQLGAVHGVRPRSPLFDVRLVERAFRMPGPYKRRGAVEKYLLKEAVRDRVPAAIVDRPKSGMMVPVEAWFAGELREWARERLMDSPHLCPFLRREVLEDLLAGRRLGLRPRRGVKLWCLLTLESWLRGVATPDRSAVGARP